MLKIKHHEFWDSRIFNIPYYSYLVFGSVLNGISPKSIIKSNPLMKNGDLRGSKYEIQLDFGKEIFPKTFLIKKKSRTKNEDIKRFMKKEKLKFPILFKPDIGEVGKGVIKVNSQKELDKVVKIFSVDYLCQDFISLELEFGIFFIRDRNKYFVSGINQKHFPKIVGDGKKTILQLSKEHYRYTKQWDLFLKYKNINKILKNGEEIKLSFIGSHTMGCKFTDQTKLKTKILENKLDKLLPTSNKFSYGRLDVKCNSTEELQKGIFQIIEINGISSLPTHMFDPNHSLFTSFKILFEHGKYLLKTAKNNKLENVGKFNLLKTFKKLDKDLIELDRIHEKILKFKFN